MKTSHMDGLCMRKLKYALCLGPSDGSSFTWTMLDRHPQDCFVRGNFVPREAERLQHGSVRVLKDLTGYQIIGPVGIGLILEVNGRD